MATVTKTDVIHVAVAAGQSKTYTDTIRVQVIGQRVAKVTTIHVVVGSLTVVAGPNIVVEAGASFVLTAVENLNGSTVASRAWKIGATTVGTAKSVTQTAPIGLTGSTVTYTYSATTTGAYTATGTLVVTVLPAMRRIKIGGVIKPSVRRMKVP